MYLESKPLKNILPILLMLTPSIALADEAPEGIFTFMYAMSIALPYVLINIGFIIFFLFKRRYKSQAFAAKQMYVGLFIFVLGLIIYALNPLGNPYIKDVVNVYMATFFVAVLPLFLSLILINKKK